MRIAIVASDYAPTVGGVQTAVRNIGHHAARLGHTVTILTYRSPGSSVHEVEDEVAIQRFPWGRRPLPTLPFRSLWTLAAMAGTLRDFKPDLVYVHFLSINALYVLLLHYVMKFKLVASARGNDIQGIPQRSRLQRWMLTRLFHRANAVLFCSSYVQRDAAPYLRDVLPSTFVSVVGDGFDPDEFTDRKTFPYPAPYVLGMGRLVKKKGFDLLIHAFAALASEFPQVELLIAGDGEERALLECEIRDLRLENRVRLLGFADRSRTIALFWGCEFFVLSSRLEPLGIVVIEAMAAHKPVLATTSGGVVDLVQDGINGLLVEPSVDGLTRGLRQMLSRPDETKAMGARAYESIQKHTWDAVTQEFLQVFEKILK